MTAAPLDLAQEGAWIDRKFSDRQMSSKEWAEHLARCKADRAKWEAKFTKPRKA